ncbi:hypothetical protein Q3V37_20655 [Micromonospora profundi]|uniref:Uncharacterized protein n=1 Tax=Micromonospora profundi TaxID=1420889 RepID=A0AAJ6HSI6_9ACTN|nr:hypothetical protein [Micromonospora profundi]WLS43808.1 hypothetical protein Q3V37_20655 [Micromonospora profundi]
METSGHIDGVVNNAGIEGKHSLTEDYDRALPEREGIPLRAQCRDR